MDVVSFRADAICQIKNSIQSADKYAEIYRKAGNQTDAAYWKAHGDGLRAALTILNWESMENWKKEE